MGAAQMLLECGGGTRQSAVRSLFQYVPRNLTRMDFQWKWCVLTDTPPHLNPNGSMWDCEVRASSTMPFDPTEFNFTPNSSLDHTFKDDVAQGFPHKTVRRENISIADG